jgi:hypothetical protein
MKADELIGKKFRIRTWKSMAEEFGGRESVINIPLNFTSEMRIFCGKTGVITGAKVYQNTFHTIVKFKGNPDDYDLNQIMKNRNWNFSLHMLDLEYHIQIGEKCLHNIKKSNIFDEALI